MGIATSALFVGLLVVSGAVAWLLFTRISAAEVEITRLKTLFREKCASIDDVYDIVSHAAKTE